MYTNLGTLQALRIRCLQLALKYPNWHPQYRYWSAHARKLREYSWAMQEHGGRF